MKISLLLLVYNEEIHIKRLIDNVIKIFDDIVVVDSYSKDESLKILENLNKKNKNIRVFKNKFISPSKQINWSIKNIKFKHDFIFKLDADEIISRDLKISLRKFSNSEHMKKNFQGIAIKRKMFFYKKILNWGGLDNIYVTRIFNKNNFKVEKRNMDEHILICGKIFKINKGYILDKNLKSIDDFLKKHINYARLEASEFHNKFKSDKIYKSHLNVIFKKHLKYKIYYKLPFFIRSFSLFIFRYIILLGFLDGKSGLIYHILNTFFYRFLVDIKISQNKNT